MTPFVGGGGLLEWAKLRGQSAIGIEIEERYCEITARRLSQGTLGEITPVPEPVRPPEPDVLDLFGGAA